MNGPDEILNQLKSLFSDHFSETVLSYETLPPSGSERTYYRLRGDEHVALGVHHSDANETAAFLSFSRHFRQQGLNVPAIYIEDRGRGLYLIEDLGSVTLFDILQDEGSFTMDVEDYFRKSLSALLKFQVTAAKGLDYSLCYPRQKFDRQSIHWDLNYFKYYFLKPVTGFHEQKLENDFNALADHLSAAPAGHFMYRDFQSRNILVRNGEPWFIDYQGGRKGPLQYDVASLLYQVRAAIPDDAKQRLERHYTQELAKVLPAEAGAFYEYYNSFVLIRMLQVLGAYGFRGLIQRKAHFIASIPLAISQLSAWLRRAELPVDLPELRNAIERVAVNPPVTSLPVLASGQLRVDVFSFSFKDQPPLDASGHGGGFVFDCRLLPNPGREAKYRDLTGKDRVVIEYFDQHEEVREFINEACKIVGAAVENYRHRKFNHLMVSFGCTGGQHRSVYCSEELTNKLGMKFPDVVFRLHHTVLEK